MTGIKTIVITWTEQRAWLPTYNGAKAALWIAEGTDADLNNALRYCTEENRKGGKDYHVHTFACDDPAWKIKALKMHHILTKYGRIRLDAAIAAEIKT